MNEEVVQVVIKLPKEVIEKDAEGYFNYFGCMSKTLYEILNNGTVLPQNPTNGDMIKAMFPNEGDFETDFDVDWWNAPYERSTDADSD